VTVRSELVWLRSLALGVLASLLLGSVTLFDAIPDYIDEALVESGVSQNVTLIAQSLFDIEHDTLALVEDSGASLEVIKHISNTQNSISSDVGKLQTSSTTIINKLTAMEAEVAAIDTSTSANAATSVLIWKQFANYLAQFSLLRDQITELNTQLTSVSETVLDQSVVVDLLKQGQDTVIALLTSIEASVKYDELTFRKRVRHALIGTTIIGTNEYEAGGQCDVLPEECTLVGESEIEVEDVII